jgi:hypothetical protein
VAQAASKVAAIPEVRAALVDFQRAFARRAGGAVLDGRDIGTVICPNAEAKLFVTAAAEVRARRRHAELVARGIETSYEAVLADVHERDERDSGRTSAPLRQAEDAVLIDTSDLSIEEAIAVAVKAVEAAPLLNRAFPFNPLRDWAGAAIAAPVKPAGNAADRAGPEPPGPDFVRGTPSSDQSKTGGYNHPASQSERKRKLKPHVR